MGSSCLRVEWPCHFRPLFPPGLFPFWAKWSGRSLFPPPSSPFPLWQQRERARGEGKRQVKSAESLWKEGGRPPRPRFRGPFRAQRAQVGPRFRPPATRQGPGCHFTPGFSGFSPAQVLHPHFSSLPPWPPSSSSLVQQPAQPPPPFSCLVRQAG